ncbi:integrase [Nostoc linckia z18]|uniref:Integrase n=2 Tax=Nostoc linckia TaxID=92942 RepID=A0A9Q5ZC87_NOSLI|nr:site-specific integrase [Nostoc linckia]PHJ60718.1 integrase [Nostoc linckia z1]PHJ62229.1 integrase [Nostoc linckia z3]PHJ71479.1 integrase [Nostoc linckia z2]PHJ80144.1 integrase [Nostoc linckia z4]PHJ97335.1 integrase [Nostoc linckia z7]PHK03692.1 integrase [Nostoc linckia z8]PHK10023.1 integrase [Nostoc linckia z9]PHK20615.1 integrase [Nostoc linckia z14]PHK25890.1 integrase [Nostoc linckia z13]PHK34262.1 integrase [Nostoc linckia z18]PHK40588.1 integrase [Nostoc linckia z15]PHK4
MKSKVLLELETVNLRLKSAKTKVTIRESNGSLQLRATLPIKPGDKDKNGTGRKQYNLSLNIPANLDGLKTAEEEAYELGKLIARKTFAWNEKYLGNEAIKKDCKTIGELLEKFEDEYFKTHKRTTKSEHTFFYYISRTKRFTNPADLATSENLINAIERIDKEWSKYNAARAIAVFCQTFKIEIDLSKYSKMPENNSRNIPTDAEIAEGIGKFEQYLNTRGNQVNQNVQDSWQLWRWTYGMLAVFGLRPRELFINPDIDWWLSQENLDLTWKVHKDCKTGEREALPLYKQWIEEFDLRNPKYLEMLATAISKKDNTNYAEITALTQRVSWWFRKIGLDFKPYDLRHAWAIRAHILGIPIKAAADNLGHSVQVHTQTYQRWFSLDMRKLAMNQALSKRNEVELIREENAKLRMENEKLRLEVEKLKMEIVYKRS